jgi:hypothetical protein
MIAVSNSSLFNDVSLMRSPYKETFKIIRQQNATKHNLSSFSKKGQILTQ